MKMRRNVYVYLRRVLLFYFLFICSNTVNCDLPVHCKREQIEGEWIFRINKDIFNPDLNDYKTSCGHGFPDKIEKIVGDINYSFSDYHDIKLKLGSDYKVYDVNSSEKAVGSWTPVYDEGFILYYKNQVFTAFMKYFLKEKTHSKKPSDKLYSSNCQKTMIGWYIANKDNNKKNWSCFFGFKSQIENEFINEKTFLKPNNRFNHFDYIQSKNQEGHNYSEHSSQNSENAELDSFLEIKSKNKSSMKMKTWLGKYEEQKEIVKEINESNLSWKADVNEEFKGLSFMQLKEKMGMKKNKLKLKNYFSDFIDDYHEVDLNNNNQDNVRNNNLPENMNLEQEINDDSGFRMNMNEMNSNTGNILNAFSQSSFSSFNSYFANRDSEDVNNGNAINNLERGIQENTNRNINSNSQTLMIGKYK